MNRLRRSEKQQIRDHTGQWEAPLTAYPATVASFFGINGDKAHSVVHDFSPHDKESW
ncbi:MAG: hypothetical protein WCP95_09175 [Actinomycetes bacterium]